MPQDAKKKPQGRPVPLTQRQVDAMVRSGAESEEVHRLIESHTGPNPETAEPPKIRASGKAEPHASTPKEAARLEVPRVGVQTRADKVSDARRGAHPKVNPPR
jgi:hypothetical protein